LDKLQNVPESTGEECKIPVWTLDKLQNVPESTGGFLHSQKGNFPEESIILSSFFNRTVYHFRAGSHNFSNWPDICSPDSWNSFKNKSFWALVFFAMSELQILCCWSDTA
jgi:hypothetical protein